MSDDEFDPADLSPEMAAIWRESQENTAKAVAILEGILARFQRVAPLTQEEAVRVLTEIHRDCRIRQAKARRHKPRRKSWLS